MIFCLFNIVPRINKCLDCSMSLLINAHVTVVQCCITGRAVDRVDGVKIAELTQKVRQYAQKTSNVVPIKKTVSKEDLNTRLKRLINMHEVSETYVIRE